MHHLQNPFTYPELDNQSVSSFSEIEVHHYDHRRVSFNYQRDIPKKIHKLISTFLQDCFVSQNLKVPRQEDTK